MTTNGKKSRGMFVIFTYEIASYMCVSKTFVHSFDVQYRLQFGEECFISGDSIALQMLGKINIFKYDLYSNSYKQNQGPLMTGGSMSLDKYHLVSSVSYGWDWNSEQDCYDYITEGFNVYHQQDVDQAHNQPYILQQNINFTDYVHGCISSTSISHDKDLLVVGGVNKTHIYVQDNNGSWEEKLVLDKQFRQYRVSGRNILATIYNETTNEDEVYYFNIEECASTPTQFPSTSTAPSSSVAPTPSTTMQSSGWYLGSGPLSMIETHSPTFYLTQYNCSSLTLATTTSIPQLLVSPPSETCYWVDIEVAFDNEPNFSVWDIQKVNSVGDNDVLKIYRGTPDDVLQIKKESICLSAGVYQFTMHDEKPKGGGFSYPGYYKVSSSGDIITQGRDFSDQCNATTTFSLPLTAAPSMMPSKTTYPTFSPSSTPSALPSVSPTVSPTVTAHPSILPTLSISPTETCYWIDVVVVFDDYPLETSWQIQKIVSPGDDIVLKTFNGTSSEANKLHKESICVEGEQTYQFTIYDDYGIIAPGHYNVTSNGGLVVQGGNFGQGEITSFSVPFVPGTAISTIITTYPPDMTPFPTESSTISSPPTELFHPSSSPASSLAPTTTAKAIVIAVDDIIKLPSGTEEAFLDVLGNDMGKNLILSSITFQPSNGKCSISLSLSEVLYIPNNTSFIGSDQCTYEACDDVFNCDTAVVRIIIE